MGTGDDDSGLTRLEIRLLPTQVRLLDGMARRLTRERRKAGRTGRRLNKSALIRAAIAVLIDARGHIHGATEAEIADSLKRWLAAGDRTSPVPRQTRDALRDARRQLATVDQLLARAEDFPPASDPSGIRETAQPPASGHQERLERPTAPQAPQAPHEG